MKTALKNRPDGIKNADGGWGNEFGNFDDIPDPEDSGFLKSLKKEMKKSGDTNAQNWVKVKKTFAAIVDDIENLKKSDPLHDEKLKKLTDDLVERQKQLDGFTASQKASEDALNLRIDEIEVAFKSGGAGSSDPKNEAKAAEALQYATEEACMGDQKLSHKKLLEIKGSLDIKSFEEKAEQVGIYFKSGREFLGSEFRANGAKSIFSGTEASGGVLVLPSWSDKMITRIYEDDPMMELADKLTISTDRVAMGVDDGEADAYWESSATAGHRKTDSPLPGTKTIYVNRLFAMPRVSNEMAEDSSINIEQWVNRKASDKMSRLTNQAFVNGNGDDKPRGFLKTENGTGLNQIPRFNVGWPFDADKLRQIQLEIKKPAMGMGTWMVSRGTYGQLIIMKDGNGAYYWQPSMDKFETEAVFLGSPIRLSPSMPDAADGAESIAFGRWNLVYQIVQRLGVTVFRDDYTENPWILFKTRLRIGGDVINGQPAVIGVNA